MIAKGIEMKFNFSFLSVVIITILLTACNLEPAKPVLPLPDLVTGKWHEFSGSENTVCADGSAYKYFAYKGTSNTLVIDFQGGGGCWDGLTCSSPLSNPNPALGQGTFANHIDVSLETTQNVGIYDHTREENPLKDAYHILIPYCTGDLHIGNKKQTYTNPTTQQAFTIEHKGAVNAKAVLDWTFENFTNPDSVVIVGCSAGAYGAAFWTETIKTKYANTPVYQFGDCGAGVATDTFAKLLETTWNTPATFPNLSMNAGFTNTAYISTLNKHPEGLRMAQYQSLFDQIQVITYALATGQTNPANITKVAAEWSQIMQTSVATISAGNAKFRSFIAQGSQHCIINSNDFYTREEAGTKLLNWFSDYIAGKTIASVAPALP
jgi:hypothetical protein